MAPSTFASAAAGGSNSINARAENSNEWPPRRANGSTQTFRRPSSAQNAPASATQRDSTSGSARSSLENPGVYIPPHRNGAVADNRYSKEALVGVFRNMKEVDALSHGLSLTFIRDWDPFSTSGTSAVPWARRDDSTKDTSHGAEVCWDREGSSMPLCLSEPSEEERELLSSVNSLLKPSAQGAAKDGQGRDATAHRKSSISYGPGGPTALGMASPTATRPGNRRREPNDAFPFPSTTGNSGSSSTRLLKEEQTIPNPPSSLVRRRTDIKDSGPGSPYEGRDKDKAGPTESPVAFGPLKRSTTGSGPGNASPWIGPGSSGFSNTGAFGNFALGAGGSQPPADKRNTPGNHRSGSLYKKIMVDDATEETPQNARGKNSVANLQQLAEAELEKDDDAQEFRVASKRTGPYQEDGVQTGSAALGGADDVSPPRPRGFGTPSRGAASGGVFASFGMASDAIAAFPGMLQRDGFHQHTPQKQGTDESMSPTNTNPYQSPENERPEREADGEDFRSATLPGLGGYGTDQSGLPGLRGLPGARSFDLNAGDKTQTTINTGSSGLPGLSGLGGLPGLGSPAAWGSGSGMIGTPTRERTTFSGAFGDNIFASNAETQSSALAGLGSSHLFGSAPGLGVGGSIGRGSKVGASFPAAIQEQIRQHTELPRRSIEEESLSGFELAQGVGAFGASRTSFPTASLASQPPRDSNSPFRSGRAIFDAGFGAAITSHHITSSLGEPLAGTLSQAQSTATAIPSQAHAHHQPLGIASPHSDNPPVAQQKTMVMPDRMRWIYKDPSGNVQGPWTGLEMHDWYKAGFFTPELLIKKVEDDEYEPLAQLIRRIGNSREPFLVPQVGIRHDPPANQKSWSGTPSTSGQPPFAGSFPSFGTTLTAEQQNALERRKQEEQFLMARQKEHLAQQQLLQKQMTQQQPQPFGVSQMQQVHHQSSAHSLQSQPSFGSITSPVAYQPSPTQGAISASQPAPGFFESSFRAAPTAPIGHPGSNMEVFGTLREEELQGALQRMNLGQSMQSPVSGFAGALGQAPTEMHHGHQVQQMLSDRMRLLQEQAEHEARMGQDQGAQASADRLQHFHDLRSSLPEQTENEYGDEEQISARTTELKQQWGELVRAESLAPDSLAALKQVEHPTLTEQVQKSQSAKQAAQQIAWQKADASTMQPLVPPTPSQSPMPAPVAQRMQNLADTLTVEPGSRKESPTVETPSASVAPWANQPVEAPKGPSLKEIQEAEARKAAQAEQIAVQSRREALERELAAQAAAAQAAPGLPSTSIWGNGQSPKSAAPSSAWKTALAGKPQGIPAPTQKQTLEKIQKEEEARKQRAAASVATAASAATSMANTQAMAAGKRYADLASKKTTAIPPAGASAWQTVGASGKAKTPQIPSGPATAVRAASGGVATVSPTAKPRPMQRSTTMGSAQLSKIDALNGFKQWAINDLRPHLNKGINVTDLVDFLLQMPLEASFITETVHSSSSTIESRHFAEEFVRRRKLADKGVVDSSISTNAPGASSTNTSGGWNEVAKKGPTQPQKEEPNNFKVVPGKKKGGKR